MTTLGSCLVANEPTELGKEILQRRAQGQSWKQIGDEMNLGSPGAARSAFTKHTGITDYKTKGPAIWDVKPGEAVNKVTKIKFTDEAASKIPLSPFQLEQQALADKAMANVLAKEEKKIIQGLEGTGVDPAEIAKLSKLGYGYQDIAKQLGIPISEVDAQYFGYLVSHEGSVAKAFKLKPTSETAQKTLQNIINEARTMGKSWDEIAKGMDLDVDIVKKIHSGTYYVSPGTGQLGTMYGYKPPPEPIGPPTYTFGNVGGKKLSIDPNAVFESVDRYEANRLYPMNNMTGVSKNAMRSYTGSNYHAINMPLRGISGTANMTTVRRMDAAMMPAPKNFKVWRRVGKQAFDVPPGGTLAHLQGTTFSDPGFLSTSIREGVWSGEVLMEIDVVQGTPSRWVGEFSAHSSEDEVVLGRNTNIVITSVSPPSGAHQGWLIKGRTVP